MKNAEENDLEEERLNIDEKMECMIMSRMVLLILITRMVRGNRQMIIMKIRQVLKCITVR